MVRPLCLEAKWLLTNFYGCVSPKPCKVCSWPCSAGPALHCTALPQLCTACEIKLNQLPCSSNHSKLVLIRFTCLWNFWVTIKIASVFSKHCLLTPLNDVIRKTRFISDTLPEAQRTQTIESVCISSCLLDHNETLFKKPIWHLPPPYFNLT